MAILIKCSDATVPIYMHIYAYLVVKEPHRQTDMGCRGNDPVQAMRCMVLEPMYVYVRSLPVYMQLSAYMCVNIQHIYTCVYITSSKTNKYR